MSRRDAVVVLLTRLEAETLHTLVATTTNVPHEELLETFPGPQAPALRRVLRKLANAIDPTDE